MGFKKLEGITFLYYISHGLILNSQTRQTNKFLIFSIRQSNLKFIGSAEVLKFKGCCHFVEHYKILHFTKLQIIKLNITSGLKLFASGTVFGFFPNNKSTKSSRFMKLFPLLGARVVVSVLLL